MDNSCSIVTVLSIFSLFYCFLLVTLRIETYLFAIVVTFHKKSFSILNLRFIGYFLIELSYIGIRYVIHANKDMVIMMMKLYMADLFHFLLKSCGNEKL